MTQGVFHMEHPLPPDPHHPGRWSVGVWKAAPSTPHPAPSHTPWKSLRDSHSPPDHDGCEEEVGVADRSRERYQSAGVILRSWMR